MRILKKRKLKSDKNYGIHDYKHVTIFYHLTHYGLNSGHLMGGHRLGWRAENCVAPGTVAPNRRGTEKAMAPGMPQHHGAAIANETSATVQRCKCRLRRNSDQTAENDGLGLPGPGSGLPGLAKAS